MCRVENKGALTISGKRVSKLRDKPYQTRVTSMSGIICQILLHAYPGIGPSALNVCQGAERGIFIELSGKRKPPGFLMIVQLDKAPM